MQQVKKDRWFALRWLLVLAICLMALTNVKVAYADEGLSIETQVGYDGQYYTNSITPIFVTLHNNMGRDLKGDLVLNVKSDRGVSASYSIPVEITNGSTIKTTFHAKGYFDNKNSSIQFYEDSILSNKKIDLTGDNKAIGKSVGSADIVGIVSSDPDTFNFLLFLNQQDYLITNVILGEDFEVESEKSLEMFSVLVLNDVATSSWPEQKIESIKKWVAAGGTLVVGGGANYTETAKPFVDILPVNNGQMMNLQDTTSLESYALTEMPIGEIVINRGELNAGDVLVSADEIPIVARAEYGHGDTYYVAFDLGAKPFSIWEGRTSFVQTMLSDKLMPNSIKKSYKYSDNNYVLENMLQYFPELKAPSSMLLMMLFAIYAIIVAPILYFTLKRFDKREWSWWIIPSGAIVATLIIVFVGAMDKRVNYLHQINVVEQNNDYTNRTSANSIFLASNKDVTVELNNSNIVEFLPYYGEYSDSNLSNKKEYISRQVGDTSEIIWSNNKYWSTRSFIQQETYNNQTAESKIDVQMSKNENQEVEIMVTNGTEETLEHIALLNGSQVIPINNLAPGEATTITVTQPFELDYQNYYYGSNYSYNIFTGSSNVYEEYRRETELLDESSYFIQGVHLVAFSYSKQSPYTVNSKKIKSDVMTMWKVDLNDQIKHMDPSTQLIQPQIIKDESAIFNRNGLYNYYLENGSVQFKYQLQNDTSKDTLFRLSTQFDTLDPSINVSIYDASADSWIPFDNEFQSTGNYMNDNNVIVIKVETNYGYSGIIPNLYLKGEL